MLKDDEKFSGELRPVRHVLIDAVTVDLKLSTNTYEKYKIALKNYCLERFQSGKSHDDLRLRFVIHSEIYYIYAGKELIETCTYK